MREALAISSEEGLGNLWKRHEAMHHMLWDGLKSMGLESYIKNDAERLITVNTIKVSAVRNKLPAPYNSSAHCGQCLLQTVCR